MESFNKEEYLRELGGRVRDYRMLQGMSQDELATKAGYTSRSSISKIEHGKADIPRSQIIAIAAALNIDPTMLTIIDIKEPTDEEIELARKIQRLDAYRRALVESIINTEPKQ